MPQVDGLNDENEASALHGQRDVFRVERFAVPRVAAVDPHHGGICRGAHRRREAFPVLIGKQVGGAVIGLAAHFPDAVESDVAALAGAEQEPAHLGFTPGNRLQARCGLSLHSAKSLWTKTEYQPRPGKLERGRFGSSAWSGGHNSAPYSTGPPYVLGCANSQIEVNSIHSAVFDTIN